MRRQTVVNWLIEQLANVKYNPLEEHGYLNAKRRIIEKARDMEKQQIEDVFKLGVWNGWDSPQGTDTELLDVKKYYDFNCSEIPNNSKQKIWR